MGEKKVYVFMYMYNYGFKNARMNELDWVYSRYIKEWVIWLAG